MRTWGRLRKPGEEANKGGVTQAYKVNLLLGPIARFSWREERQQGIQILHILTPGAMPWQPHHSIPPYANVSNIPFLYSTSHPPPSRPQFTRQASYAILYWQVYPPMAHFNFMTSVLTVLKTIISRLKRNTISRTAKPCNHVCSIENSNNHSHENDAILHTGNIHTMLSLSLQGNDCNSSTVINVIPLPIP